MDQAHRWRCKPKGATDRLDATTNHSYGHPRGSPFPQTDLSVEMDCLTRWGFPGSVGSWRGTETAKTRGLARREVQDRGVAGRSPGRWHCAA